MSKREQSELLLAVLVSRLSENGVMAEYLSARDMFGTEPTREQTQLFVSLVDWLESEGVIRMTSPGTLAGSFSLVLTAAGFRKLTTKLTNDLTLGAAINETATSKRLANGLSGLGELMGGFAAGAMKTFGNG